jgi:hypothetical protein
MPSTNDGIHITTNPAGTGWVARANGTVISQHRDKSTAIKSGRLVAKRHGVQFTVHRKDGTVSQTRSYGASPI